jgi:hypothetical protein
METDDHPSGPTLPTSVKVCFGAPAFAGAAMAILFAYRAFFFATGTITAALMPTLLAVAKRIGKLRTLLLVSGIGIAGSVFYFVAGAGWGKVRRASQPLPRKVIPPSTLIS